MLNNINYFYTRDVRESVDKLLKLLEPSLTLPGGWEFATALDGARRHGDVVTFAAPSTWGAARRQ